MREWLVWLLVGLGLAVAELLSLDLVLIMLAPGAFAAAAAAALGGPLLLQGVLFAIVSGLALFLVRPVARAHLERGAPLVTGVAALVGKEAMVLEQVGTESGLVKLDGEEWTARPFQDGQIIEPGATVEVITIQGATALVWRKY
jgi:membrane protein implicated in regulation of membrane protease activity